MMKPARYLVEAQAFHICGMLRLIFHDDGFTCEITKTGDVKIRWRDKEFWISSKDLSGDTLAELVTMIHLYQYDGHKGTVYMDTEEVRCYMLKNVVRDAIKEVI